jgi:hypothetical protein
MMVVAGVIGSAQVVTGSGKEMEMVAGRTTSAWLRFLSD